MSSRLVSRQVVITRSTTDTFAVGTRIADPFILPTSAGKTSQPQMSHQLMSVSLKSPRARRMSLWLESALAGRRCRHELWSYNQLQCQQYRPAPCHRGQTICRAGCVKNNIGFGMQIIVVYSVNNRMSACLQGADTAFFCTRGEMPRRSIAAVKFA